jgi:O-antigen/teichoic acid export membrane protein
MSSSAPVQREQHDEPPPFRARAYLGSASWIAGAELAARLKGLVLLPLLTRYLGAVDYGAWAQVSLLVTVIPLLLVLGTDSALIRYLPGTDDVQQRRWFSGWVVALVSATLVVCVVMYVGRHALATVLFGSRGEYARLVGISSAVIVAGVLVVTTRLWFRVRSDARWFSFVGLGQAITGTVAVVLMLTLDQGIYELVIYQAAGDVLLAALMAVRIARRDGWMRPDFSPMPRLLRFGLPLIPAAFATWGLNWMDRLFLVQYATLADVGVYSLAYTLGYLAIQLVANPVFTMFPTEAAVQWNLGRPDEVQRLFEHAAGVTLLFCLPLIVGAAVAGPAVVAVLAPPSFSGAADAIPIILAGYLLLMIAAYYETTFGLVFRQWLHAVSVGVALVVNAALNVLLIPRWGYMGAAVATSVAFATQCAFTIIVASRLRLLRTPIAAPLRIVSAALAMGAAMYAVRLAVGATGLLELLAMTAAGAAAYAVACLALRVVSVHTLRQLAAIVRGLMTRRATADDPVPPDPLI